MISATDLRIVPHYLISDTVLDVLGEGVTLAKPGGGILDQIERLQLAERQQQFLDLLAGRNWARSRKEREKIKH